jgi:hypothetical protein
MTYVRHNNAGLMLRPWLGPVVLLLQLGIASAAVSCSLRFEGYGNKQGLKSAHLSCTGGSITAAAHPVLLAPFSRGFSGVTWSSSGGCGTSKNHCLLTICGSSKAAFFGAVIANVDVSSSIGALLCVRDSSNLVFDSARFHGNSGLQLLGDTTAVHLHIKNSRFTNNSNLLKGLDGAALLLKNGTGLVQSCTFAGNRGLSTGGAIALGNNARMTVMSSVLQDNTGRHNTVQPYRRSLQLAGPCWLGSLHMLHLSSSPSVLLHQVQCTFQAGPQPRLGTVAHAFLHVCTQQAAIIRCAHVNMHHRSLLPHFTSGPCLL